VETGRDRYKVDRLLRMRCAPPKAQGLNAGGLVVPSTRPEVAFHRRAKKSAREIFASACSFYLENKSVATVLSWSL
jgi:hypothetical protein